MKAAVRFQYGMPDLLSIQEVEKPTPKANEVLIKVYATTVNRTDCGILTGKPSVIRLFTGLSKPRSPITGTDFAGQIEAVGSLVTTFTVGDRVWGLNDEGLASHAQYMVMAADKAIATSPAGISYEQAAASPEGAHYAYNFLTKVKLKPGDNVLIYGATGAIGSAAVQLAAYLGAHVTAVCGTNQLALVKSLGADKVIDYTATDFTNDTQRYHFVFDAVGKSSFGQCKPLLLPGGIYISSELGPNWENLYLPLFTAISGGKKVIFPIPVDKNRSIRFIKSLLEQGKFNPVIDRIYPLEQLADAFRYVMSGQKIGNVILQIPH